MQVFFALVQAWRKPFINAQRTKKDMCIVIKILKKTMTENPRPLFAFVKKIKRYELI